jgi:prepilin-type N-terminal cleavage/methylation domain-containing protein
MTAARRGFTLIELMIVIAIIAVIAAIAIPGLIASQRASNERNASATLKTVATAEIDFRGNDRDGNKIQDFWTRDLSGLYGLCPIGSDQPIKLLDIAMAGADSNPQGTAAAATPGDQIAVSTFSLSTPKASFWFLALITDETGTPYAQTTAGIAPFDVQPWFNHARFAFLAYPESFTSGRQMFYINETNTLLKRTLNGRVRPAAPIIPPGTALLAAGATGTSPLTQWPTEVQLKADYSKLD